MLKLFTLLRPYGLQIISVVVLLFLQSLSDLYLPTLMADIVDIGIVGHNIPYILRIGALMLVFAAGGALCSVAGTYLSSRVSASFGRELRSKVFSHVENFSLQEFDSIGTASLITRTTNDITQVQMLVTMMLRMMITAPLMCIGGVIMAVYQDTSLSLIFVVILPLLALVITLIFQRSMPLFKAMQAKLDRLNLVLREYLTGIRVIRSFNRTDYENQRFDEANLELTNNALRVNLLMASLMPVMMLLMNLSSLAIIWFGGIRINSGGMQVGALIAFIQYSTQIMFSLVMVSFMLIMVPRASASALRINQVLEMHPTIVDPDQSKPKACQIGCLDFDQVTFSYPGAEQPAITDISFSALPGQVTAIIGGTGSGKSTLLNLIPRFYDVDNGRVLVDGVDVRELTQSELRAKIGFVPQQAVLFTGTIGDNLRFGLEQASDEQVEQAAETAQALDFIREMPEGFSSEVEQGGKNLSGGQKQRLSIARALVRKPEIYLFDDSFSALDFRTDARLRAALKQEITNATMIIVAQRVSTVMDADRIIVLDDGQVAGIGTHADLLAVCEVYREIVYSQLSEEEIA